MNKLTEGKGVTSLYIDKLYLVVNDSEFGQVQNVEPFFVTVDYYYEAETDFDTPDGYGYFGGVDINKIICDGTLWFKNNHGVRVQIMWGTNLLNLLSPSQYEFMVTQLISQCKGSVNEAKVDKYIATREDANADVQRMMGMK